MKTVKEWFAEFPLNILLVRDKKTVESNNIFSVPVSALNGWRLLAAVRIHPAKQIYEVIMCKPTWLGKILGFFSGLGAFHG